MISTHGVHILITIFRVVFNGESVFLQQFDPSGHLWLGIPEIQVSERHGRFAAASFWLELFSTVVQK